MMSIHRVVGSVLPLVLLGACIVVAEDGEDDVGESSSESTGETAGESGTAGETGTTADPSTSGTTAADDSSQASCDELGTICHDAADEFGMMCHEVGHAGDEAACAEIWVECLAHCIAGDGSLAGSRFAGCGTSSTCGALLPCVRASWPTQAEPGEPELTPSPSGSGCREGCKRLGECFDAGAPLIDDCTQGCEDKLGDADEIAFGECTRSSDCLLMLECMQKFPGA